MATQRHQYVPLTQKNIFQQIHHDMLTKPSIRRRSMQSVDIMATSFFLISTVTLFYVAFSYVVPYCYQSYGETFQYYSKVLTIFLLIQVVANWICTRFYSTNYCETSDRPNLVKTLWDDYNDPNTFVHHSELMESDDPSKCKSLEDRYLTGKRCVVCQHNAPPRSHHCNVCKQCILKKEIHCYIVGKCIGFYNQRYFIVMCFYIAVSFIVGMLHFAYYVYHYYCIQYKYVDLFLPVTLFKWLLGDIPLHDVIVVFHCHTLWWMGALALTMFSWQLYVVYYGKTTYEMGPSGLQVRSTSTVRKNFQSVFGEFWLLNFFIPTQIFFRQDRDGTRWEELKALPFIGDVYKNEQ